MASIADVKDVEAVNAAEHATIFFVTVSHLRFRIVIHMSESERLGLSARRKYSAPHLVVYGRLAELTASGSGVYVETSTQRSTARQRP